MLIQYWAACSVDQDNKIMQFNPRMALVSGFEENSDQLILLDDPELQDLNQTTGSFPLEFEIGQDLKTILQIPPDGSDVSSAIRGSNQDDWRKQFESSFNQILEIRIESDDLGELSSKFSTDQAISNQVNSNMMSLVDNGEGWDAIWGTY